MVLFIDYLRTDFYLFQKLPLTVFLQLLNETRNSLIREKKSWLQPYIYINSFFLDKFTFNINYL